jgi:hypothetical protein
MSLFDSVVVFRPHGYVHNCFAECALAMNEAAKDLGWIPSEQPVFEVDTPEVLRGLNRPLVFGVVLAPSWAQYLPEGSVLYNLEQSGAPITWGVYQEVLKRSRIWDYDPVNRGTQDWPVCRIGYHPVLSQFSLADVRPIDVFFYGSINARRADLFDRIRSRGLNVVARFGVYGEERDRLMAQSKVVLNLHYHSDKGIFEQVRCQYPLSNRIAVVSETGASSEVEAEYAEAVRFAPYEGLADACKELARGPWKAQGDRGFEVYSTSMLQSRYLSILERPVTPG